jgi:hypothetical protein
LILGKKNKKSVPIREIRSIRTSVRILIFPKRKLLPSKRLIALASAITVFLGHYWQIGSEIGMPQIASIFQLDAIFQF